MKEITRRLYTKPVMLGMAFLIGAALVVGLFATTRNSSAAPAGFPVLAGNDEFETPANGETFHDFGGSPLPANFFGPGSQAFSQLVALEGVPLSSGSDIDTIIQRYQTVSAPGGSTDLQMTGLSLKSSNPLTVTYSSGASEAWNMTVGLSQYKASTGAMTINATTMDSTLKVWPRFTFTRVSDGATKVYDTGNPTGLAAAPLTRNAVAKGGDSGTVVVSPVEPAPAPAPAPCKVTAIDSDSRIDTAAAASSSCAPVSLSCVNAPWSPCGNGGFCLPPLTEAERWARHNPWPKGTKRAGGVGAAE
ncbi:MAG TPA: hypothetical protein VI306_17045 [Pyrinomonadaceae bacterium]